jgi:hypothetical protein
LLVEVGSIALLTRVKDAISAQCFVLAGRAAAITGDRVSIVALLSSIDDSVAASDDVRGAVVTAGVGVVYVSVIALFELLDLAIAADTLWRLRQISTRGHEQRGQEGEGECVFGHKVLSRVISIESKYILQQPQKKYENHSDFLGVQM